MQIEMNKELAEEAGERAMDLDDFVSKIAMQLNPEDYNLLMDATKKLMEIKRQGIVTAMIT
jgi:hypothetical protein